MGAIGDSYDNAMAESFWASLKRELVDWSPFATYAEARAAVFECGAASTRSRPRSWDAVSAAARGAKPDGVITMCGWRGPPDGRGVTTDCWLSCFLRGRDRSLAA